jgi:hypothetical protein
MQNNGSGSGFRLTEAAGVKAGVVLTTPVQVHVDAAIAPSTSKLHFNDIVPGVVPGVVLDVDAEPSDWWWDQEFDAYVEDHLGRYGY